MAENILVEVRKAYRLLFDYQSRILNLMEFIGQTFEMPYVKGYPKFSTRGTNKLGNWSWDWLYMYYYEFHFRHNDGLFLSVFLLNDSGYFETNFEKDISPLAVEEFKDVNNSETKLIFVAGYKVWKPEFGNNWNSKEFILNNSGKADNSNMIFKSYNLDKFFNEEDTLIQLKDFEKYCNQNEIPLKVKDKII